MGVDYKIFVYSRVHLRDESLEYELMMGYGDLESMFDTMQICEDITKLYFPFPERFLNVLEQRELFERIKKYFPNAKSVQIKTHSPFIIQSAPKGSVHLLPVTKLAGDGTYKDKLYDPMVGNLFNSNTVNIVSASGVQQVIDGVRGE